MLNDEAGSKRDHVADTQNGPESETHNNTMDLGPPGTLIEPCEEDSSSRNVLLKNMSNQDKDLSENGTLIEPCEKDSSSRDVLLTNTSDQDKDLSENGSFKPKESNTSEVVQDEENEDIVVS